MGTPEFAVPPLEALVRAGHEVVAVYTQPDRPKGRGQKQVASPVKQAAERLGLRVKQPEKIRRPEAIEELKGFAVPAMVVVGYGQILPQTLIDLAPLGIVNVHGSLLPKYRGAAPIQWAIANGETVTGVTTMKIDAGLDTGAMLLKAETEIGPEETAPELAGRLSAMGAALIVATMQGLEAGTIMPEPQDQEQASIARILTKEDGRVEWTQPARQIHNRVRGFQPWPGAYTTFRGTQLRILRTRGAVIESNHSLEPGELIVNRRQLLVRCGEQTALELLEVQLEGRGRVTAEAFLNGHRVTDGERLENRS